MCLGLIMSEKGETPSEHKKKHAKDSEKAWSEVLDKEGEHAEYDLVDPTHEKAGVRVEVSQESSEESREQSKLPPEERDV
ncbi:hypothetical protein D6825_00080 [Candidatus Woesearchaeota archaeon]|nr:MAG: hypothetical protein D6825_00080 [Candidatus Woesearchaeota archaeon]